MPHRLSPLFTALCILSTLSIAHAFQPTTTWRASSSFVENQALYITGGFASPQLTKAVPQTFMIDLSVSWSTNDPVYKQLPDGPATHSGMSALSSNGKDWLVMSNNTGYVYNTESITWTPFLTDNNFNSAYGLSASTNPDTGLVYIPNGIRDRQGKYQLLVIDMVTKTQSSVPMHSNLSLSNTLSASWSQTHGSLLVIGGSTNGLYTFNPSKGWSDLSLQAKGDIPATRTGACFAPVHKGAKMVYFGGTDSSQTARSEIFILDVPSLTWTKGPNVDPLNARAASSCAVSNDFFIVWGGLTTNSNTSISFPRDTTLVFDLKTSAWMPGFVASTTSTDETSVGGQGSVVRTILIVVLSLLVVFLGIAALVICRRPSEKDKMMAQAVSFDKGEPFTLDADRPTSMDQQDPLPVYAPNGGPSRAVSPSLTPRGPSPILDMSQQSYLNLMTLGGRTPESVAAVPTSASSFHGSGYGVGHDGILGHSDPMDIEEGPLQSYHLPNVQYGYLQNSQGALPPRN